MERTVVAVAKICYVERRFHPASRLVIDKANEIIENATAQGYDLTLRQIYYRFIALDWFPAQWIDREYNAKNHLDPETKNTIKNYKRLGELLNDARLAGLVDWDAMVDRTRNLLELRHWDSPADAIRWAAEQYRTDKWAAQPVRVEVWIEKDALIGVFQKTCFAADIDAACFSCKGYNSQSEMWSAAQRILWYERERGQQTIILQFSDHDPSGIDMHRDITDRLNLFGCSAIVRRMALTMKQVKRLKLPPNPAKETDDRFAKYAKKYGRFSWELDALEPVVLDSLVRKEVIAIRDGGKWAKSVNAEKRQRAQMVKLAKQWTKPKRKKR